MRPGAEEIASVRAWTEALDPPGDVGLYLDVELGPEKVLAASFLIWPDFVELDDMVFLASAADTDAVVSWTEQLGGDRAAIERMLNHTHLRDAFINSSTDESEPVLESLAALMVESWSAALGRAFPHRSFSVERADHYGPGLTFSTVREGE
jgi:hypothetical protein